MKDKSEVEIVDLVLKLREKLVSPSLSCTERNPAHGSHPCLGKPHFPSLEGWEAQGSSKSSELFPAEAQAAFPARFDAGLGRGKALGMRSLPVSRR